MAESKISVNVYENGSSTPLLEKFYIFHESPRSQARMIGHPVEDGTTIFDNKVIQPDHVSISGEIYTSESETMMKIQEMLRNKEFKFYTISGFALEYENMSLVSVQQRENAENPDTTEVTLEFQEVLKVSARAAIPREAENESTRT